MKNFFLLLLTIGMMAVTTQAQEVLDFTSKTEKHVVYYIPTDDLVQIIHTSKTIEDELADQMIEDYANVFPSSGPNEPAVQILKPDISDIVLFIQYKDDYIYSFRSWLQKRDGYKLHQNLNENSRNSSVIHKLQNNELLNSLTNFVPRSFFNILYILTLLPCIF